MSSKVKQQQKTVDTSLEEDPEVVAEREYALQNGVTLTNDATSKQGADLTNGELVTRTGRRSYSISDAMLAPPLGVAGSEGVVTVNRQAKNARKSRAKTGRGEPKKHGGGGKYTWGKNGEIYDDKPALDSHDPNYDSEEEESELREVRSFAMSAEQLDIAVMPVVNDYLASGDLRQTADALHANRMNPDCRSAFVVKLCNKAIDGTDAQREMACVLVEHMVHRHMLTAADVQRAMECLCTKDIDELAIDYPGVGEVLGAFLARFIADQALEEAAVEKWYSSVDPSPSEYRRALERCRSLLCQPNALSRLHDVWGVGGAQKPVRQLSDSIVLIVKEYMTNNDAEEAAHSLKHLQVPHFNHEMVYQTSIIAVESMHVAVCDRLAKLLGSLMHSGNLSSDCVEIGITRFYGQLADIQIDLPPAYALAERWIKLLHDGRVVSTEVAARLPKGQGRKRFMSEGDGGKLSVCENGE